MTAEGGGAGSAANSKTFTAGITGTNNLTIKQNAANEQLFFTTGSINFTGTLTHEGGTGLSTISSVIGSNVTNLTQSSSGKLILSGANTYTGATTISAGTLQLGASSVIPDGSALSVASGATFNLAGFSETVGSLAGAGTVTSSAAGTMTLTAGGNSTTTTFSGIIQNGTATSVALTKLGSGTLTLSGANPYTGATTVSAGTLALTGSGAIGASAVTVSGGTFSPGGIGAGDASNAAGTLTISSGGTVHFDLAEPSSTADDQIQVAGAITLGGTLTVNNLAGFAAGTYRLMTCSGTPTGSFATINLPAGYGGSVILGSGFVDLALSAALPVTWLDFTGEQVKGLVRLDWQTASEQNSSHFEIERSANGGDYTRIGSMKAAGNSANIRRYEFTDETAPTGLLLYRLRQVDIDGRFSYSKIVQIRITAPLEAKIGPNPTGGAITLQIPAEWKSNVEWRLYNTQGHLLEQRTKMASGNYTIDLSKRSAGTYQLTLWRNGELVQKEWIIRQ